jgi:Domain of unknown function (DUF6745)
MRLITRNRKAVREALAREGWRFSLVSSVEELSAHRNACRTVDLPAGSESDNRLRTIREALLRPIPWEFRRQTSSRWLSYISRAARKRLQPHLPIAAEFCFLHGFIFLLADVWAERNNGPWRVHRTDGPAVLLKDRECYFWRGWQVSKEAVTDPPTAERILQEGNQTHREVLLQRMGVETFVREAELKPMDTFQESVLLKADTTEKRSRWRNGTWEESPLQLAFLKVICPSTRHTYFLRVNPDVETAKEALESTLPNYTRDWARDLVAET